MYELSSGYLRGIFGAKESCYKGTKKSGYASIWKKMMVSLQYCRKWSANQQPFQDTNSM